MCTVAESTAWSTVSFWSGGQARFRRGTPESGGSAFEENLSHAAPSLLLESRASPGARQVASALALTIRRFHLGDPLQTNTARREEIVGHR